MTTEKRNGIDAFPGYEVCERIREYINAQKIKKTRFDASVGLSRGHSSAARNLTAGWLSIICKTYPTISAEWLLRGEGNMLRTETTSEPSTVAALLAEINAREEKIRVLIRENENLRNRVRELELGGKKIAGDAPSGVTADAV